ncbi:hypothetical protein FB446DRAFT_492676 [Lentinula raphanica]|nr:hypothetical protein FB446DRAFT_492676 [Lentinula raphanica]
MQLGNILSVVRLVTLVAIFVRRMKSPDGEYPLIHLGGQQALKLEPQEAVAPTSSNLHPRSGSERSNNTWWDIVVDSGSGSAPGPAPAPGSEWMVKPSPATVAISRPVYFCLGTLRFFDPDMKQLLVGGDLSQTEKKFPIHSPLYVEGSSSKTPTRQMRIEAANAMVERFRELDTFFEKMMEGDPKLAKDYADLQEKREERKREMYKKKNAQKKAAKEGKYTAPPEESMSEEHANKKQKTRRSLKSVFDEVEDPRTKRPVWDEYVQALRSGTSYAPPPEDST